MEFESDPAKAASNVVKHGISFEEAQEAFGDPNRLEFYRPRGGEDRYVMIGASPNNLLVVVYTERGKKIRIISARRATKDEKATYRRR
ncbi:MAG: BrnT family toxin [Hyphomicrobium sp.]|uniref:BrnT family toxin n=1 Tax=Hyphomicrobium sp. TaxID=82 RepID=UPI0039E3C7FF